MHCCIKMFGHCQWFFVYCTLVSIGWVMKISPVIEMLIELFFRVVCVFHILFLAYLASYQINQIVVATTTATWCCIIPSKISAKNLSWEVNLRTINTDYIACVNANISDSTRDLVKASFSVWCMNFWTFHNKSHNMKALVILSHSWSPFLPLTCLYGNN